MIRNFLTIAWRNLLRNKVFSLVNISGLAVGMAACFLVLQYVRFEWSYDKFHKNSDRIYRVTIEREHPASAIRISAAHPGVGPAMKEEFAEVEEFTRVLHQSIFMGEVTTWSHIDDQGNEKVFNEERVYCVDPSFPDVFSFPFVYGDPKTALSDISSVVIAESISRKFFGSENPIGRTLLLDGRRNLTVTGVFKDVPENSHLKFNILVTFFFEEMKPRVSEEAHWKWAEYYTYVRLMPGTNPSAIEARFPDFVERHMGEYMRRMNFVEHFHLQPVVDIHLRSPEMTKEREVHGSERTVYFLLIVAILILVIAWTNYVNLSTSKSIERAREVGVRKVSGASKRQLIIQFLLESVLINLLATFLGFALVGLSLPYFNQLAGKNIGTSVHELTLVQDPLFWAGLAGVIILGSFAAGFYPALVLSSFRVTAVLKGKFFGSRSGIALRKTLVGSQFIVSVALIAGTIIVFQQVSFMRNHDLGYAMDQILVVKSPRVGDSTTSIRMQSFKTELLRHSSIHSIAPSSEVPGRQPSQSNFIRNYDDGREEQFLCFWFFVDSGFFPTYDVALTAGRNFDEGERVNDNSKNIPIPVILNEKATRLLRFEAADDAVKKLIHFGFGGSDYIGEIVGVVADFHQRSLKTDYDPIIFFPASGSRGQYLGINMWMQSASETIAFIEDQYRQAFPGNQFEYFFLDDYFNDQYAADQQFGKVFGLFSGLALLVAGLGLFGLSTFMISQRTKEIAVRKVLGATIASMVPLFSKDFVKLIVIANLIALPVVYFLVDRWLNSFAFRINIGWIMFVVPAVVLLVISLITVSVQTMRTSSANPVKSLRSE